MLSRAPTVRRPSLPSVRLPVLLRRVRPPAPRAACPHLQALERSWGGIWGRRRRGEPRFPPSRLRAPAWRFRFLGPQPAAFAHKSETERRRGAPTSLAHPRASRGRCLTQCVTTPPIQRPRLTWWEHPSPIFRSWFPVLVMESLHSTSVWLALLSIEPAGEVCGSLIEPTKMCERRVTSRPRNRCLEMPRWWPALLLVLAWSSGGGCSQPRPYVGGDAGADLQSLDVMAADSSAAAAGGQGGGTSRSPTTEGGTGGLMAAGGGPSVQGMGSGGDNVGGQGGVGGQSATGLAGSHGGDTGQGMAGIGGGMGNRDLPMSAGGFGGMSDPSGGAAGTKGVGGGPPTCPPPRLDCGGVCVDPLTNDANCGDCANNCSTAQTCMNGKCVLLDGQPCETGNDCASGVCNVFFRDEDGDGYGTPSSSIAKCSITAAPPGYASNSRDCCDNGGNVLLAAKIHPGADFQSTPAGGLCGVTWDYDCSGNIDLGPDFDVFTYCQVPCSDPVCQASTCKAELRSQDPNAAEQCGVGCSHAIIFTRDIRLRPARSTRIPFR